ncbi:hypothetical protein [Dendronalium sp. ChiSLP03b]|uniref:hypothetical protein n=1 Tax=Dendronalium sp. ChiSLP03b TaxID=3075381 RepID=UPI002AD59E5D|nr:hypothetical protein [Dendronalium sp. ChiSLP03b]MDZ8209326.1 hypothetical protein [Dendronalium sp. ChiSLP03b]
MEITLNRAIKTIDIMIPKDRVSDDLLGVLPEPTTAIDGCLTRSIGFSDAFRVPETSSSSTGATTDELFGTSAAIVKAISPTAGKTPPQAEGKIRGTLILSLSNSLIAKETASIDILPRAIPIGLEVTPSSDSVFSSNSRPFPDSFGVIDNLTPILLFANPFSA